MGYDDFGDREATLANVGRSKPLSTQRYEAIIVALRDILAIREGELLDLKGPCRNSSCRLHYAHSGPCEPGSLRRT